MLGAAGIAVVVSLYVAPQLRNADALAPADAAVLAEGRNTYMTTCAACHGTDLKAGGVLAAGAPPPLDASGHAWLHSDATLFRMVKYGIANCHGDPTQAQMPGLGDRLDDRSIGAVLAFVKNQWPADQRIIQDAFNDGESDAADSQIGALCTPICGLPPAKTASAAEPNLSAR